MVNHKQKLDKQARTIDKLVRAFGSIENYAIYDYYENNTTPEIKSEFPNKSLNIKPYFMFSSAKGYCEGGIVRDRKSVV
jgi:hypothetical protein